ncbi:gamma-aminobutyric acid receptor subunit beta-3-like [Saccostrea echinata]|uniref:gamma-aminobutyric acid receptor subunit beta-3-like n=1 Tax=Saccostrea echinata TaxID=191078 RepID=UPI002A838CAD|nr:gamma-aminobutyric acid receptor subunit beta-3-like [Saccostrea echinata]XP_061171009.1 gamma-aminobutyric acid receptor subunit beta-3-like [Saccostrea echinata]
MLTVQTLPSEDSKDEKTTLPKLFKDLSLNIEKNNEFLARLIELSASESESLQGAAPVLSVLSKIAHAHREERVTVELRLTFMKINDIDTVDQKFQAEIFIQAKWEDPSLKEDDKVFDPVIMWTPKLIIINVDGSFLEEHNEYSISHSDNQPPQVNLIWRFKAFFKENLELQHFPIDVQDLTISISTERTIQEVELIEDHFSLSSVNTQAFLDASEWSLYNHTETYQDQTTIEYARSTVHPILHVQCRVARKIGYFVWNIIFIVFLIIALTFASYSIEVDSSDRLAVNITLFLTAVAFKLVVKQSLPTISYLTYLDLYVLAALIFLAMNATQNATMKSLAAVYSAKEVKVYDRNSIVCLTIIFLFFHVIFGIYITFTATRRRWKMKEKDKLYQEKKEYMDRSRMSPRGPSKRKGRYPVKKGGSLDSFYEHRYSLRKGE